MQTFFQHWVTILHWTWHFTFVKCRAPVQESRHRLQILKHEHLASVKYKLTWRWRVLKVNSFYVDTANPVTFLSSYTPDMATPIVWWFIVKSKTGDYKGSSEAKKSTVPKPAAKFVRDYHMESAPTMSELEERERSCSAARMHSHFLRGELKETPGRRTKQQLAWLYSLETRQTVF